MALRKQEVSSPKTGMNRDSASFEVDNKTYTFALNLNIHDEHGSGPVVLQNEPSNLKCTGFKAGYKVVGHKYDQKRDRVYFFLTNPTTSFSEIGYIEGVLTSDPLVAVETGAGDQLQVVLETPLEDIVQANMCTYITLITDQCEGVGSGCLNFSINSPIHERNIQIKRGKLGDTLWWVENNFKNPQRFLREYDILGYTQSVDPCTGGITNVCLDCEKMRVFPLFEKPCLHPTVIQNGGNLRAGTLEVLIAYSSERGEELTNYYAITNPIAIHDKNNNILDQTQLDYFTNQAVEIQVTGLDNRFEYYKIAVVYRSGLDAAITYYDYGVFTINQPSFTIFDLQGRSRLSASDVISRRPFYTGAKSLAVSNGYLYQSGLKQRRVINLQPVVNLLGSLARWTTHLAKEDLYENGINVSNYLQYMRDEVYPFSVRFIMGGGHELPLFPFIARPPKDFEVDVLGTDEYAANDATNSILINNPECFGNTRDKRWQFENTAEEEGFCSLEGLELETTEVVREVTESCVVSAIDGTPTVIATVGSGTVSIPSGSDIVTYINNNIEDIAVSTDPDWAAIAAIVDDASVYPATCTPDFGLSCDEPATLVSQDMFAISVGTVEEVLEDQDVSDYTPSVPPSSLCPMYILDSNNVPDEDAVFTSAYMNTGEFVLKRNTPTNQICTSAVVPPFYSSPQVNTSTWLSNRGELTTIGTLQSTQDVTATRASFRITLIGTSGTANVNVNGVNYLATYSTSISVTVANFVVAHAAAILTDTGLVATASGSTILLVGDYDGFFSTTTTNLTGDLAGSYNNTSFTNKLHSNAVWFKVPFDGESKKVFEVGTTACQYPDDNTGNSVRVSVFIGCAAVADIAGYAQIIDDISIAGDTGKFFVLDSSDFGGISGTAYIAIDSPIRSRDNTSVGVTNTLTPPCDCFPVFQRQNETINRVTFTALTFGKKQEYTTECTVLIPKLKDCETVPYKKGWFSYWESVETYPCNDELFDSSVLKIVPADIPASYRSEFEDYYVVGGSAAPALDIDGNYVLKTDTDFRDKPIRHYKFPDNRVAPFMSGPDEAPSAFGKSVIYPIGFYIDNEAINAFLDIAVTNDLLTQEERDLIVGYEIFRGDRRVQKSVISKGLAFDMYKYTANSQTVYYPNYPLNALGYDQFNAVGSPNNTYLQNNFFTVHTPDTEFYKPTLPREVRIEGYQFGQSANYFDEVQGHPTYVVLGNSAFTLATSLAIAESALEILLQTSDWLVTGAAGSLSAPGAVAIAIVAGAALIVQASFKVGEYRYRWLDTISNLGNPQQFAYYQVSVGHYNYFRATDLEAQALRGLSLSAYIKEGRLSLTNETTADIYNINNLDREYSVAIHTGAYPVVYPSWYANYDNSSTNPALSSRRSAGNIKGKSELIAGRAASPYISLKQFLPAQYGEINSITWINTGFCGDITSTADCDAVFGGDIAISRFSLKRKLPFFRTNAYGLAPLTPFKYSDYFNINPEQTTNRFYLDYEIHNDGNNFLWTFTFPSNESDYYLDGVSGAEGPRISGFYVKPPYKFYLYSYGIPYFLTESEINCNFRYAKRELHENFYPNINDVVEWTQEKNVSIRQRNTFYYNTVYSLGHSLYPYSVLPLDYKRDVYDLLNDLSNTTIYSAQDISENSVSADPWLRYRAIDAYDFSRSNGALVSLSGIESLQVLARFTDGFTIFGAVDQLRDRLTPETENLGTGGIFAGRPVTFNETDLGHAGTTHTAMVSCEFGHFWVDSPRGKVFQLAPGGKGLQEISRATQSFNTGMEKWFKENLPFKILNYYPDVDIDNNYNGFGITMAWDDRFKRVILTKKDFVPSSQDLEYNSETGEFFVEGHDRDIIVEVGDPEYFNDCSWTIAYNPFLQTWISYYSFKPDYYVSQLQYFQSGINRGWDQTEFGLWSHLAFQSSYQVFYGKFYPFIIEYPISTKISNSVLEHVEYWLDVRKYYNRYNFADAFGIGFNKAVIYNSYQNTGQLNLVHQDDNDMRQNLLYPNYNADSIDILQSEINGKWSFNYIYNLIRNERSGLPIWIYDCSQVEKTLDNRLLNYTYDYKDRLRGDYFILRLINDQESRFKFLFRFGVDNRSFYEQ
jgi:hypothetical protein